MSAPLFNIENFNLNYNLKQITYNDLSRQIKIAYNVLSKKSLVFRRINKKNYS